MAGAGLRGQFSLTVGLLAGSFVAIFLILLFNVQIASYTGLPPTVLTFIAGGLIVGFYEGLALLRDIFKEREQLQLRHSEILRSPLKQWSVIQFVKDVPLIEPANLWAAEFRQHIESIKEDYLFVATPDGIPRQFTVASLWHEALTESTNQAEEARDIRERLVTTIGDEVRRINPATLDFNTGKEDISKFTAKHERYCRIDDLARFVYRKLNEAVPVGRFPFMPLPEGLGLESDFHFESIAFNLNVRKVDSPSLHYNLDGEFTYAVNPDKDELDSLLQFINNIPNSEDIRMRFQEKNRATNWARWALEQFEKSLIEIEKDLDSFKPIPGHCDRCP